jgi:hypothetical protein
LISAAASFALNASKSVQMRAMNSSAIALEYRPRASLARKYDVRLDDNERHCPETGDRRGRPPGERRRSVEGRVCEPGAHNFEPLVEEAGDVATAAQRAIVEYEPRSRASGATFRDLLAVLIDCGTFIRR